jgi:putative transposase
VKGARKGRKLGAPRFRSKRDRAQSIRFTKAAWFKVTTARRLRLPKIGDVPWKLRRAQQELALSGLARTRLARSVHDAEWSMFVGMLAYKAQRAGRTFARVNRWFPSTRACSACGAVGEAKPLHVRTWTCRCGITHDRDINAAINILAAGRADRPTLVELVSAGTRSRNRP